MPFGRRLCHARASDREFATSMAEPHYPPDLELEPRHLDISIDLDLEEQTARAIVVLTIFARNAGPQNIALDAVDVGELAVQDVDGRAVTHTYDGRKIAVQWADAFTAGEERRLEVRYDVVRPTAGLYFSRPTHDNPSAPLFAATDHETERARHWLSTVDLPSIRPRLDFHIRANRDLTILANGLLLREEHHGDGTKTAHYRLDKPCPSYLTCFAVGEFVRLDDGEVDGVPVASFAIQAFSKEHLERTFGRTKEILRWLVKKLGSPFPYPKYFQFAVPGIGGAMENISLTSWDDRCMLDETLASEFGWQIDQTNVHEAAHSYFGDSIVCRDFAHSWLKESWATYMESCWLEDHASQDEADYDFLVNAESYFAEADGEYQRPIVTRVFDHSWGLFDRHLYPGGACRLHTLRRHIGDGPFWAGVRDYVGTYSGQLVETDDFRKMLEKHSGRSLVRFFEQWFLGKGYPHLKATFRYDAQKKEGTFEIQQEQADDAGKGGLPVFDLDIDLGWVVDGRLEARRVELRRRQHTFSIPMDKDPEQVRIDPYLRALYKLDFNPGDDKLRTQLVSAKDVVGRILAGRELAKTGRRRNLEAIAAAYRNEAHCGVRREWMRALAKVGSDVAVSLVVELAPLESHPWALEGVLRAAGTIRDEGISKVLLSRLTQGLPYRAAAAALEGLGTQRGTTFLAELERFAERRTFGSFVQVGAVKGLATTRERGALEPLRRMARDRSLSVRVRSAAVAGLGELGAFLERADRTRIREELSDDLRDTSEGIRRAALDGLGKLGDVAACAAIEAYRRRVAEQETLAVDRVLNGLRSAEPPKVATLEKRVEELEAKVRKLTTSLERLEDRAERGNGNVPDAAATQRGPG